LGWERCLASFPPAPPPPRPRTCAPPLGSSFLDAERGRVATERDLELLALP